MEHRMFSSGHQQAVNELQEIAEADPAALEILAVGVPSETGWLPIDISLGSDGIHVNLTDGGTGPRVRMRAREQFHIVVPHTFPLDYPYVWVTHDRFAHLPHVQWRRFLCLYISPTTEWQPADGMFGLLERLLLWIERAANGTLDPTGEPLHPPAVYTTTTAGSIVIRADTPTTAGRAWSGFAVLRQVSETRVDLVGWLGASEVLNLLHNAATDVLTAYTSLQHNGAPLFLGLATLLPAPTAFEFPTKAHLLVEALATQGVSKVTLIAHLAVLAHLNQRIAAELSTEHRTANALYVLVGTPMRGIAGGSRQHHLAAWKFAELGQDIAYYLDNLFSNTPDLAAIGVQASALLSEWLELADLSWARVYEDRPEVTVRRDAASPMHMLHGQRVLLLGCGAIGGHIAEHLVRAGVAHLTLVDRANVSPGVLVRQPYDDADIDQPKAQALAQHLQRIRPDVQLQVLVADALITVLQSDAELRDIDMIIDAAANPAVTIALEHRRRRSRDAVPTILTFVLGHTARRGIVTIAPPTFSGAGVDLMRKVKLETLSDPGLQTFADDFFPDPPRSEYFQPEPGCSEATFVGSDAEVAGLTATMLVRALRACTAARFPSSGSAVLVDLGIDELAPTVNRQLQWSADHVTVDVASGFEVRISEAVLSEIRAECRLMARRRGQTVETGGILLGEIDDACGVVWASMASGPPPDSRASALAFVCGIEGVAEIIAHHDRASRGSLRFLGMWHSHPSGQAMPSTTDDEGMRELVVPMSQSPRRALLLIVGGSLRWWQMWIDAQDEHSTIHPPQIFARMSRRPRSADIHVGDIDQRLYPQSSVDAGTIDNRRWPPHRSNAQMRRRWWRLLRRRGPHEA